MNGPRTGRAVGRAVVRAAHRAVGRSVLAVVWAFSQVRGRVQGARASVTYLYGGLGPSGPSYLSLGMVRVAPGGAGLMGAVSDVAGQAGSVVDRVVEAVQLPWVTRERVALTAVVVAVVLAMMTWGRAKLRSSRLGQRSAVAMVPTRTFDPSLEEVLRFANQLVRTRPATRRLSPRSASAVRVRLASIPGGGLVTEVEGPARSESVVRLGCYAEVDLRPVEALRPPPPEPMRRGRPPSVAGAAG